MTRLERRKLDLEKLFLAKGNHETFEQGMCAMEAVAYLAGEPHTDHPECASPVISQFMRTWNDDLDDAGRQLLKPYLPRLIGTRASKGIEEQRGWMCADWLIRQHAAAWLDLAGLKEHADTLRRLPEIRDVYSLDLARPKIDAARGKAAAAWDAAWAAARDAAWDAAWAAARDAAWAAAWAAARDAAWAAARDAARDAAWDAARDAAWDAAWAAARDAAWAAARDAARDAAWAAARDAARKKLEPTKISLQASAFDLLERMIALGNGHA